MKRYPYRFLVPSTLSHKEKLITCSNNITPFIDIKQVITIF